MAFSNIFFWFVVVVLVKGSPVKVLQNTDGQVDTVNCIPTKWGCIDMSDPSFRPRLNINDVDQPQADNNEDDTSHPILNKPCIPTPWGCIEPSDPSIRPEKMPSRAGVNLPADISCQCIPTPYGCIDPCDPGIRP